MNWKGLAELQEALRNLPATLASEANGIVLDSAKTAISEMRYPTGVKDELNKSLTVEVAASGPFGAKAIAKNTSKLAVIFERGSMVRHTALGWNRGRMPAGNIFIPAVLRNRARMYERLKALLVEQGLKVSGDE
jgi:hypothetical protein